MKCWNNFKCFVFKINKATKKKGNIKHETKHIIIIILQIQMPKKIKILKNKHTREKKRKSSKEKKINDWNI
jgi:hypothetical protein